MNPGQRALLALKEPLKSSVNYYVPSVVTQGHTTGQIRLAMELTPSLNVHHLAVPMSAKRTSCQCIEIGFSVTGTSILFFCTLLFYRLKIFYDIQLDEESIFA